MKAKPVQIKSANILDYGVQLLMERAYRVCGITEILAVEVILYYIEPFIAQLAAELNDPQKDGLQALKSYFASQILDVKNNGFKGGCLLGNLMGEIGDTSEIGRKALLGMQFHVIAVCTRKHCLGLNIEAVSELIFPHKVWRTCYLTVGKAHCYAWKSNNQSNCFKRFVMACWTIISGKNKQESDQNFLAKNKMTGLLID